MGYYFGGSGPKDKAIQLVENHGGKVVSMSVALDALRYPKQGEEQGVIVVLDNGLFEAAGLAYDESEFNAFTSDERIKTIVVLRRKEAYRICRYTK